METALLAARLLLALVFGVAAVGKLLDRDGSRRALADFGVPAPLAIAGTVALSLAELGIAAALLTEHLARWAALAAVALVLAFIAGIANALVHDSAPECHCFGQLHSAPASTMTLARNAVLLVIAGALVWFGPGPAIPEWVEARSALELGAYGGVVGLVVLAALALHKRLERRAGERAVVALVPAGLPMGSQAPQFGLPGLSGEEVTLESLCAQGRPVVLVFVHLDCPPCRLLLAQVGRWQASLAQRLTIAVLSQGGAGDNRPLYEEHGLVNLLLQESLEVYEAYRAKGTPSAVVVGVDGTIASATGTGEFTIQELVRLALRRMEVPEPSKAGLEA